MTRARRLAVGRALEVIPSASRLIHSLRDLGYDFGQAVADLVDNSITAGASSVCIDVVFEGPESWIRISDDGHGMAPERLDEAMRYGSRGEYGEEDLGKFGLGLKTASFSQCRRLTVASRPASGRSRPAVRQIDLDHISQTDRWEVLVPRRPDPRVLEPLHDRPGTAVLWEGLDRILGYKIPWGRRAETAMAGLAEQLGEHLGMVFHRFLSGEAGERPVEIRVNGEALEPWDPFARSERRTRSLPGCDIDLATEDGIGLVRFQPFVLPAKEEFSSEEAFHRHAGPRKWNAQQGFYIYRANRLIQSGGWCRMRAFDEHVKLARAAIDFYPELDSAFQVNVAKVRVVLPGELRERLKRPVENLVSEAQKAYRRAAAGSANGSALSPKQRAARRRRELLESCARTAVERRALARIMDRLGEVDPRMARDLGW